MVVQYILAVRKGKREMKDIQKLQTAVSNEQPTEGQPEAEEVPSEDKIVEVVKEEDPPKSAESQDEEDLAQILPKDPAVNSTELGDAQNKVVDVEEYYVKYRNFSYLHCEWKIEDELYKGDKRIAAKLKRFKQKMAHHANIFENVSRSTINISRDLKLRILKRFSI